MHFLRVCQMVALLIAGVCLQQSHGRTSEQLKVKLNDGSGLVGRFMRSISGRGIRAFLSVPYALPPVGELRFKAPLPQLPWQGDRPANRDGPMCTQRNPYTRENDIVGGEDCLTLNVYTPLRPASKKPLAVMVFLHGGGFMCGAGIEHFYGPDHLLDHDIVYVGVNYRLGPLGFLSTGQANCPGNNGLKDQVRALQWIQENVAVFGGNPKKVTIFGESAGGASVTYHMMSPLSKGLFHRAISQSGSNLNAWAQPAHDGVAVARAERLATIVGCPKGSTNWSTTLDCIRNVSAERITEAFYDFFEWDTDPMVPFPPVVEIDLPGAFITEHPRDVIQPHSLSIPYISGITTDEGLIKTASIINLPGLSDDFNQEYDRILPIALYYNHLGKTEQKAISDQIIKYYFNNQQLTESTQQNLTNLFSDAWFMAGVDEYLRIRLAQGKAAGPTFVYLYAHAGEASFTEVFQGGAETYYGVSHGDELQSLFPIGKGAFPNSVATESDDKVRQTIVALWVNFARSGNPSKSTDATSSDGLNGVPQWKHARGYPLDYLRIGTKDFEGQPIIGMESGLMADRAEFWKALHAHLPAQTRSAANQIKNEL